MEELKRRQLAHHQLNSQLRTYFSPHSTLPMTKAQIPGRMVSNGIGNVAIAPVHTEKTRLKKLMKMLLIITSDRKNIY